MCLNVYWMYIECILNSDSDILMPDLIIGYSS